MPRVPIVITLLLAILAFAAALYVARLGGLSLTDSERIQAQVGIFATFGALVSAAFVIYSYAQTNRAFIESQRPQLLMQVVTQRMKIAHDAIETFPATFIRYQNITANQFSDLTISMHVVTENRSIDISDLFKPKMVMIGSDQRQRWFDTYKLLERRALDLKDVATHRHEILLKLAYSYTYNGERKTIPCQEYRWEQHTESWGIA